MDWDKINELESKDEATKDDSFALSQSWNVIEASDAKPEPPKVDME